MLNLVFISTAETYKATLVKEQALVCKNLIKGCDSLSFVKDIPEGCALSTAVPETKVYLLVKGQVDISVEIDKFKDKLSKVEGLYEKLFKRTEVDEYKKQVKDEVQKSDAEKLAGYQNEIDAIKQSISQFEKFL